MGASLVVQWLRMQGTWGWISEQRKPHTPWSKWARAPQYWARTSEPRAPTADAPVPTAPAPQQEKPLQWETCAPQQSSPRLPQPEEAHIHHWRPGIEIKKFKKKKKKKRATFWPKWNFNYWGFLSYTMECLGARVFPDGGTERSCQERQTTWYYGKNIDFGITQTCVQVTDLLLWSAGSYLTSLGLNFLMCEM